ncbi:MAG: hypothetical protein KF811_13520 [Dokdonella sp.]|nr:hypothetical protein [Dokdonella sp.]
MPGVRLCVLPGPASVTMATLGFAALTANLRPGIERWLGKDLAEQLKREAALA